MLTRLQGAIGTVLIAGCGWFAPQIAIAKPMVYSADVVTDIKVGGVLYRQAAVKVMFAGDTNDIKPVVDAQGNAVASAYCASPVFFYLAKGTATLTVESRGREFTTAFLPDQIFVAVDTCNGGIGFGSFTGPGGLEPAYPLAFTLGTAMSVAVDGGLLSPAHMSGNAWSCIGYPTGAIGNAPGTPNQECIPPDAYPLKSEAGNVYFHMPYRISPLSGDNHIGTLNRGTFSIISGE